MTDPNNDRNGALSLLMAARAAPQDEAREPALAKLRARGALTARERIAALVDADSFVEYGLLAGSLSPDLTAPADGVVTGIGSLDGAAVGIVAYDYSVFAGSQGAIGHHKLQRLFEAVAELRCPLVMLLEGGGARAQEVGLMRAGAATDFVLMPRLAGRVPIVSAVFGRAFAGHAIMAGVSDVVIALKSACLGVAGPPLVEAALGQKLTPEQIGAAGVHLATGAVDLLVDDDPAALAQVKRYLRLVVHQRGEGPFDEAPVAELRGLVPANPRLAYDVRKVIDLLVDEGDFFELKQGFAANLVVGLGRLGGRVTGVIANQPRVFAGTIDAPAAQKMARFIRLCDRNDLPLLFLVDSPGFLIGPEAEQQGVVVHGSDSVIALAQARVPILQVVLRKSYGMSSLVMGHRTWGALLSLAWPTAEFGVMGLKGAARIVGRGDAGTEAEEMARLTEKGSALGMGRMFQFDDVIDPADTRAVLIRTLRLTRSKHHGQP